MPCIVFKLYDPTLLIIMTDHYAPDSPWSPFLEITAAERHEVIGNYSL